MSGKTPSVKLPLTKTLSPADYKELVEELKIVDQCESTQGQASEHRRWEYAMALHAIERWRKQAPSSALLRGNALDVGGGGSPLASMLEISGFSSMIIDPGYNYPIEEVLRKKPQIQASVVTCISVIEHVPIAGLELFLRALGSVVYPGGLLFLTCDYTDAPAQEGDKAHFNWMRQQIFTKDKLEEVALFLGREYNLQPFGEVDYAFHGNQVYDYTFASLCLSRMEIAR